VLLAVPFALANIAQTGFALDSEKALWRATHAVSAEGSFAHFSPRETPAVH
jgi:hypothetical protein